MSRSSAILSLTLGLTVTAGCGGNHLGTGVEPTVVPTVVPASTASCPVTPRVYAQPPRDPNPFYPDIGVGSWYINADRTMWASAWEFRQGGNKVMWIRPAGEQLVVTGQRLDAEAAPLSADIPCCYPSTFQASGLTFPTSGCWQVTAQAGRAKLQFVIEVGVEPSR